MRPPMLIALLLALAPVAAAMPARDVVPDPPGEPAPWDPGLPGLVHVDDPPSLDAPPLPAVEPPGVDAPPAHSLCSGLRDLPVGSAPLNLIERDETRDLAEELRPPLEDASRPRALCQDLLA